VRLVLKILEITLLSFVLNVQVQADSGLVHGSLTDPEEATPLLAEITLNDRLLNDFHDVFKDEHGALWLPMKPIVFAGEGRFSRSGSALKVSFGASMPKVTIDPAAGVMRIDDQPQNLPSAAVWESGNRIFVHERLLYSVFGINADYHDGRMRVVLESETPLPADLRKMRERRWQAFGEHFSDNEVRSLDINHPYVLWGEPRGRLNISSDVSDSGGDLAFRGSSTVQLEAAFLTNRVFLAGDGNEGLRTLRWEGGRESPDGNVLGIRGLHSFEMGDISSFQLPLVEGERSGRGIAFSTAPFSRPDLFDTTRIEGDAIPGWDAELYEGSSLVDFQRIGDDGRYTFDEIPLRFGTNDFRVVLYGPEGQVEERSMREIIPGGLLIPGEVHLRGSFLEAGREMFPLGSSTDSAEEQLSFRTDVGVTRSITGSFLVGVHGGIGSVAGNVESLVSAAGSQGEREYFGVGFTSMLGPFRNELTLMDHIGNGRAVQIDTGFSLYGTSISTGYTGYENEFLSDNRPSKGASTDSTYRFSVRRGIGQVGPLRLGSVALEFDRRQLNNGNLEDDYGLNWRHQIGGLALSHDFDYRRYSFSESTSYALKAAYQGESITGRGEVRSSGQGLGDLPRDLAVESLTAGVDYHANENRAIRGRATYRAEDGGYNIGAGISQSLAIGRLGVSGNATDSGEWSAGISFSVGFEASNSANIALFSPRASDGGAVALRTFQDIDSNGVFDPGVDHPMPQVGFLIDQRAHAAVTDSKGKVTIQPLSTRRPVEISVNHDTLEDPFIVPAMPPVEVQGRPGFTQYIPIPMVDSAAVSGNVTRGDFPLSAVTVTARSADGRFEQTVRSVGGGFFSFDALPPGDWSFTVDRENLPKGWDASVTQHELKAGGSYTSMSIDVRPPSEGEKVVDIE
jgi:hypothetical protein